MATGQTHQLRPGVMCALDRNDHHVVRARTPLTAVCVFWPPLVGHERHNATGGYEASG